MSLNYTPSEVSADTYQRIFDEERQQAYPMVDAFEAEMGYGIDRERLESIARVLSCPYKAAKPNWQHGRVLYAAVRNYLARTGADSVTALDIGTAKGFSALCVRLAIDDAGVDGTVTSVDVMPPTARVRRNTIAEVERLKTLAEILAPFPAAERITFVQSTGIEWLQQHQGRVHIAFVDGKHTGPVVRREGVMLAGRQESGDIAVFDDVHIPEVSQAVTSLHQEYRLRYIEVLPKRAYAVGVRR